MKQDDAVASARRPLRWLAIASMAGSLGMVAFIFLSLVLPGTGTRSAQVEPFGIVAYTLVFLSFPTVGGLIALRRPLHAIGWLFLIVGASMAMAIFSTEYMWRALDVGWPLPFVSFVAWCGNWTFLVGASVALTLVPLLFPDGRWLGRGWRLVGWAAALTITVGAVAQSLPAGPISGSGGRIDNPIAAPPALTDLLGTIASLAFPVVAILGLLSIASLFVRFRRADRVERAQLKWFLSAVSAFLGMLAFAFFFQVDGRQVDQLFLVAVAFLATIPIATGVAILRYRLFDIDRIISRTIGWLAVTGILGAVFAGGVLFAQAVLEPVTGGSTIGVAAATLVAAALFAPVRSRVQRTVDRRFNRARYDAERTAAGFAARLRDDVDLARVVGDLSGTAQQTLAPASMSVWIKGGPAR